MTAETDENDIFVYNHNGGLTRKEYYDLNDQLEEADARGDDKEYDRLLRLIPITAKVAKAAREVWGKEFIISSGFDLTEANKELGEGWLDE